MKNRYISKTKKATRVALFFTFLQISLMAGLLEDSRILYLLLRSICGHMLFWLKDVKKIWPRTDMYLEKRNILIVFQIIVDIFL